MIEDYAESGLTRSTMRKACNLTREEVVSSSHANHEQDVPVIEVESVESRRVPANLNCKEDALVPLHLKLVSLCLDKCKDVLSDKGVGRLTVGIWSGMSASQRNEMWAELLSSGFWRKLSGKRQEFAIPVLRLRRGLREVLGIRDTVSTRTRLRETYQVDSVLRASECVMSARNAGMYKAYLEEQFRSTSVGVPSSEVRALREKCEKQLSSLVAHATWFKKVKDAIRQKDSNISDVVLSRDGRPLSRSVGGLRIQVSERGP